MPSSVLTLCSGGLDSAVLAYYVKSLDWSQTLLFFNYDQRNTMRELAAIQAVSKALAVPYRVVDLDLSHIRTSAVTNTHLPLSPAPLDAPDHVALFFPNRNIIFLAMAFAQAVAQKHSIVAVGSEGGAEVLFPDNREDTLTAYSAMQALALGKFATIGLFRPLVYLTKPDVVALGQQLAVPFDQTWSCYDVQRAHCGVCRACQARRDAFRRVGLADSTEYLRV